MKEIDLRCWSVIVGFTFLSHDASKHTSEWKGFPRRSVLLPTLSAVVTKVFICIFSPIGCGLQVVWLLILNVGCICRLCFVVYCWLSVDDFWLHIVGCRYRWFLLLPDCRVSVVSCWLSSADCTLLGVAIGGFCFFLIASCQLSVVGCRLSSADCTLLGAAISGCCCFLIAGCQLSVVGCRLLNADCTLSGVAISGCCCYLIARCQLSVVSWQLVRVLTARCRVAVSEIVIVSRLSGISCQLSVGEFLLHIVGRRYQWLFLLSDCRVSVVSCWLSVVQCWLHIVGYRYRWLSSADCTLLDVAIIGCCCFLIVRYQLSVVGCRLSSAECTLLGVSISGCCCFLIVGYQLSVVGCRLSNADCTLWVSLSGDDVTSWLSCVICQLLGCRLYVSLCPALQEYILLCTSLFT
jgi:hypothetical protein